MAKIVMLIETELPRGRGVWPDPVRTVRQWWSVNGDLVVEHDPGAEEQISRTAVGLALEEVRREIDENTETIHHDGELLAYEAARLMATEVISRKLASLRTGRE